MALKSHKLAKAIMINAYCDIDFWSSYYVALQVYTDSEILLQSVTVNLCKFRAWRPDILADKLNPDLKWKFWEKGAAYMPVFTLHFCGGAWENSSSKGNKKC